MDRATSDKGTSDAGHGGASGAAADTAPRPSLAFWFVFGLAIWLVATAVFALAGDLFFERGAVVYAVFVGVVCLAFVTLFGIVARVRGLDGPGVLRAAVAFSIAGLLGEVPVMMTYPELVPALAAETAGAYSGFLFLGYAALLAYALAAGRGRGA